MAPTETFIQIWVDDLTNQQAAGVSGWVRYSRRDTELAAAEIEAALEAGRRVGFKVHADYVPEGHHDAVVHATEDTVVIRISDTPAPWNRRRRWWQRGRS